MAGSTKTAVIAAFFILAVMMAPSVPAVMAVHCLNDCIERCSNGKNLDTCQPMCKTACTFPAGTAEAAKEAATKVTDAVGV